MRPDGIISRETAISKPLLNSCGQAGLELNKYVKRWEQPWSKLISEYRCYLALCKLQGAR